MTRGQTIGCIAMTEPHAGSDLQAIRPRVRNFRKQKKTQKSPIFL